jgi:hypothetical protein
MEKTRSVSLVAAIVLASTFLFLSTITANASGTLGRRMDLGAGTVGNRLLPLRGGRSADPQVPAILQPTTGEVSFGDLGATPDVIADFNGDGKTDFTVVRNTGGGNPGQLTWFLAFNGTGTTGAVDWGLSSDWVLTQDFDGDGKDDVTVWRAGSAGVAAFYVLQSATSTFRIIQFGQSGDLPSVTEDYDGDGKADPAVFRPASPATWFYQGSFNNPGGNLTAVQWGLMTDVPAPGDFDGDGKNDFGIYRNSGTGQLDFWRLLSNGTVMPVTRFGSPADFYVPGDYDGDGKTDIATFRYASGQAFWFWQSSINGNVFATNFGIDPDLPVQGDYDGDGKTDIAIFRRSSTPGGTAFWVLQSSTSTATVFQWGLSADVPIAAYNVF